MKIFGFFIGKHRKPKKCVGEFPHTSDKLTFSLRPKGVDQRLVLTLLFMARITFVISKLIKLIH